MKSTSIRNFLEPKNNCSLQCQKIIPVRKKFSLSWRQIVINFFFHPIIKYLTHLNALKNFSSIRKHYIHFEITSDSCNLVSSYCCRLFPNCIFFCSNSQFFPTNEKPSPSHRNQTDFQAFREKPFTLGKNKKQHCNFLPTSSVLNH